MFGAASKLEIQQRRYRPRTWTGDNRSGKAHCAAGWSWRRSGRGSLSAGREGGGEKALAQPEDCFCSEQRAHPCSSSESVRGVGGSTRRRGSKAAHSCQGFESAGGCRRLRETSGAAGRRNTAGGDGTATMRMAGARQVVGAVVNVQCQCAGNEEVKLEDKGRHKRAAKAVASTE